MSYQRPLSAEREEDKFKSPFTSTYSMSQMPLTGSNPVPMSFAASQAPLAGGFPAVPSSSIRPANSNILQQQASSAVKFAANEANSMQAKLKNSAQYVSGIVQREQLVPDLAELLTGKIILFWPWNAKLKLNI